MLKAKRVALVSIVSCFLLIACESNDVNDEFKVADLKPIENAKQLEVNWNESAGSGVKDYFSNLRPVSNSTHVFAASREGVVFAFDAENGEEIWQTDIRDPAPTFWSMITFTNIPSARISGGLTYAYGNVYLGTEEGLVVALKEDTGEIVWSQNVSGEIIAPPGAGEGWIAVSTTSGKVVALHPDTGEKRWEVETDVPPLTLRGTASPAIANGGVLVGTATGKIQVFILNKGIPAWDATVGVPSGSTELEKLIDSDSQPVVSGSTIFSIAYNGNLVAVDMKTGRSLWKREYSSYRNIAIEFGTLYLTDFKGNVVAVDASNGVEKWTNSDLYNRQLTEPVIYQDKIVVGDFEGYFHFLDKTSGKIVARYQNDDFFEWFTFDQDGGYSAPLVVGDDLVIQTRDGEIWSLRFP